MLREANTRVDLDILLTAYRQMCYVSEMAKVYDQNRKIAKYVHSTSRGHEAIQLAAAMQLAPYDYVYPYYRDEAIMLGIGMTPYDMMLQLLARRDDPFSAGRMYYAHPSLRDDDKTQVPFQSSATGMQAIPATGAAHGLKYREQQGLTADYGAEPPLVVCSLGDGAITEGECSEAFQMAVLHDLPIVYLIQDNDWGISATGEEMRAMDAVEFAQGFKGLETTRVDGSDFFASYQMLDRVYRTVREERRPILVHARVPLLGHHTSGVRREFYRSDEEFQSLAERDPRLILEQQLQQIGMEDAVIENIQNEAVEEVHSSWEKAKAAADPDPAELQTHYYAPTPITEERGTRQPEGGAVAVMVDAALHAMEELMQEYPEALLYGQDVGGRLGGVFREAATLAGKFGDSRVFNTPIQEAYIIGSTSGMSAVGCKPVVEIQFADYIWPGLNQLFTELSRSNYLSVGKWPIQSLIRVPTGAYGGGGPYHSSSIESVLLSIKGIKVAYPSNTADMKGLYKAAFYDPNPVVLLEHKGLYWSAVPGTKAAKTVEPASDYVLPLGQARIDTAADQRSLDLGDSCVVLTYGMGVYWTKNAVADNFAGRVEIIDLRSLEPLDWATVQQAVRRHGKVLIVTEEPPQNGFAEALAGRIMFELFEYLDAPVRVKGSVEAPGIPVSEVLEAAFLPGKEGTAQALEELLAY
jgi:2-oxoisovalerate dehydrogenase E1 component